MPSDSFQTDAFMLQNTAKHAILYLNASGVMHSKAYPEGLCLSLPDLQELHALSTEQQLLHASQFPEPLFSSLTSHCHGFCRRLLLLHQRLCLTTGASDIGAM